MFEYRHALVRLRAGDTVREIARNGLMGRDRLGALRTLAEARGWLPPDAELPDDATLAAALGSPKRAASTVSSVELKVSGFAKPHLADTRLGGSGLPRWRNCSSPSIERKFELTWPLIWNDLQKLLEIGMCRPNHV